MGNFDPKRICSRFSETWSRGYCESLVQQCRVGQLTIQDSDGREYTADSPEQCVRNAVKATRDEMRSGRGGQSFDFEDDIVRGERESPLGEFVQGLGRTQCAQLEGDAYWECVRLKCPDSAIEEVSLPLQATDRKGKTLATLTDQTVVQLREPHHPPKDQPSDFTYRGTPIQIDQYCGDAVADNFMRSYREIIPTDGRYVSGYFPLCWNGRTTFVWRTVPDLVPRCQSGAGQTVITHKPSDDVEAVNLQATITWQSRESEHADVDLHLVRIPRRSDGRALQVYFGNHAMKRGLDWGVRGNASDNPLLDLDCRGWKDGCARPSVREHTTAWGPENVRLSALEADSVYLVAVRAYRIDKPVPRDDQGTKRGDASCLDTAAYYEDKSKQPTLIPSEQCRTWTRVDYLPQPTEVKLTARLDGRNIAPIRVRLRRDGDAYVAGLILPKPGLSGEGPRWEFIPGRDLKLPVHRDAKMNLCEFLIHLGVFLENDSLTTAQRSRLLDTVLGYLEPLSRKADRLSPGQAALALSAVYALKVGAMFSPVTDDEAGRIVAALVPLLKSEKASLAIHQAEAMEALAWLAGSPELKADTIKGIALLVRNSVDHRDSYVRQKGLAALGQVALAPSIAPGDEEAIIDYFIRLAGDKNRHLRLLARQQLKMLAGDIAIEPQHRLKAGRLGADKDLPHGEGVLSFAELGIADVTKMHLSDPEPIRAVQDLADRLLLASSHRVANLTRWRGRPTLLYVGRHTDLQTYQEVMAQRYGGSYDALAVYDESPRSTLLMKTLGMRPSPDRAPRAFVDGMEVDLKEMTSSPTPSPDR